jgi:hypothetical protein
MKEYVLLKRGQKPIQAGTLAYDVGRKGFKATAEAYGLGESTLRKFLNDEGFRFKRSQTWQVEHLPGLENDGDDDAAPAAPGADEREGETGRLPVVEGEGVRGGHQPLGVGTPDAEPGGS